MAGHVAAPGKGNEKRSKRYSEARGSRRRQLVQPRMRDGKRVGLGRGKVRVAEGKMLKADKQTWLRTRP